MAQTLDTRALNMLLAHLLKEKERRLSGLTKADSWDDYKERVGFLNCIEFVERLCPDVESELFGGQKKK